MATIIENRSDSPSPEMCWPFGSTVAEIQARLGDIPSDRLVANPPLGLASEEDVAESKSKYGKLCELVDGVLVEKAVGYYESTIAGIIFSIINEFLSQNNLGLVSGESGPLRLLHGNVRMPDVSFISWDRFPDRKPPRAQVMPVAPSLAVEVISPSNTKAEMDRKLRDYFAADVKLVWFIDPQERAAKVYNSPDQFENIDEHGELSGDPLLPGLRISLKQLFAQAYREPPPAKQS